MTQQDDSRGDVLLDDIIETDYGQFDIVYDEDGGFDGDIDRFFAGQVNGLVGAADPHGVYIGLARRWGGSRVRIVLYPGGAAPPATDESWEDIVEVSTTVPDDEVAGWATWGSATDGYFPGLEAGDYRMRVSARGRDAADRDELHGDETDAYLVELWPASWAPDSIIRTTSANADRWHATWGGRR